MGKILEWILILIILLNMTCKYNAFVIDSDVNENSINVVDISKLDPVKISTVYDLIIYVNNMNIINITTTLVKRNEMSSSSNSSVTVEYRVILNQINSNLMSDDDDVIKEYAKLTLKAILMILSGNYVNKYTLTTIYFINSYLYMPTQGQSLRKCYLYLVNLNTSMSNLNGFLTTYQNRTFIMNDKGVLIDKYDSNGAIMYTAIVITVYAMFVLCLLILRVKPNIKLEAGRDEDREKAARMIGMRDYTVAREILEQLRNENYRKKVWAIYNSNRETPDERILLREENTIRSIHKRIDYINRSKIGIVNEREKIRPDNIKSSTSFHHIRQSNNIGMHSFKRRVSLFSTSSAHSNNEYEQTSRSLKEWARQFQYKFSNTNNFEIAQRARMSQIKEYNNFETNSGNIDSISDETENRTCGEDSEKSEETSMAIIEKSMIESKDDLDNTLLANKSQMKSSRSMNEIHLRSIRRKPRDSDFYYSISGPEIKNDDKRKDKKRTKSNLKPDYKTPIFSNGLPKISNRYLSEFSDSPVYFRKNERPFQLASNQSDKSSKSVSFNDNTHVKCLSSNDGSGSMTENDNVKHNKPDT